MTSPLRLLCLGALLAAAPLSAFQQSSKGPLPAGAITGVVVDGASGAAVPGAVLTLAADPARPIEAQTRQLTDDKGRFAFLDLPSDLSYTIAASTHGYLPGGYGRETSPAEQLRPIRLQNDEWVPNVRILLWRPGSIGGMVRDEAGEPVVGVLVRALVRFRLLGRDQLAAGPMTVTDDRGVYRLSGLPPGRYVIQVPSVQASLPASVRYRPQPLGSDPDTAMDVDDSSRLVIGKYPLPPPPVNGRPMAYPMAFHPSATAIAQAAVIDLQYGDDRTNVDVSLTPVPASRVSGTVEGPPEALAFLTLRLLPAGLESLGQGAEAATVMAGADGQFTFLNVPAGSYTIDAPLRIVELTTDTPGRVSFPVPPGRYGWQRQNEPIDGIPGLQFMSTDFRGGDVANYSARGSVTVDATDVHAVVVRLRPNATMTGRVVPEVDPARPGSAVPDNLRVMLDPAGGEPSMDMPHSRLGPGAERGPGEFAISGIMPGKYWLRLQRAPAGWLVKSVMWKGRDYAHEPFDAAASDDFSGVVVTVTNAAPELSGSVRGTGDLKPDQTMVVAFPANRSQWQGTGLWPAGMKSAPVSSDGRYRMATLPAGEYFVSAIDRAHYSGWRDPDFLAGVERSATRVTLSWGVKTTQDVSVAPVRRGASRRQR